MTIPLERMDRRKQSPLGSEHRSRRDPLPKVWPAIAFLKKDKTDPTRLYLEVNSQDLAESDHTLMTTDLSRLKNARRQQTFAR